MALGRRRAPQYVKLIPTQGVRSEYDLYQHKFAEWFRDGTG
jgi:hypothetical protein